MTVDVTMPQLGETVSEGTVTRWLRQVGDEVNDNEPLLEISTDKVDTEVPSPASGTLVEILVAEDSTVAVGTLLGRLRAPGEARTPATAPSTPAVASPNRPEPVRARRHRHTPRVRHRAAESGVDLAGLIGSGPGGRVTVADLDRALAQLASTTPSPVAASRAAEAPEVSASDVVPTPDQGALPAARESQFTAVVEVDLTSVAPLTAPAPAGSSDTRVTLVAVVVHAAAQALRDQPPLHGAVVAGQLGIAVDTGHRDLVRSVRDARDLNLGGLARRIAAVTDDAAAAASGSDAAPRPLFVVSDSGARQLLWDTPVLSPGQAGMLTIGTVTERPVVARDADGGRSIAIRSMAYLSLSVDPRWIDGADTARLVNAVKHRLESMPVGLEPD